MGTEQKKASYSLAKVYQSNTLIRSSYRLAVREQRLILCACSKIKKNSRLEDGVTVTAKDMVDMGYDPRNVYREMESAAKTLFERKLYIRPEPGIRIESSWIQTILYDETTYSVSLVFSHLFWPLITNLKKCFTVLELDEVKGLSTFNAIRLYQMFLSFEPTGWWRVSVEELREILCIAEDEYLLFCHFNKRVVQDSINQINKNQNNPLYIETTFDKKGRKVVAYLFQIKHKSDVDRAVLAHDVEEVVVGFTRTQAKRYAAKLLKYEKWPVIYESLLRKKGLDLQGANDEVALKRLSDWLFEKTHIPPLMPHLEAVGYKRRIKK